MGEGSSIIICGASDWKKRREGKKKEHLFGGEERKKRRGNIGHRAMAAVKN